MLFPNVKQYRLVVSKKPPKIEELPWLPTFSAAPGWCNLVCEEHKTKIIDDLAGKGTWVS